MKRKTKTALELLEREVTKLTSAEALSATGGYGPPTDCVFQAVAFASGRTLEEVKLAFGSYIDNIYVQGGGSGRGAAYWGDVYANTSMNGQNTAWLVYHFGMTSAGDRPVGGTGFSYEGDQSIALLYNYYTGGGHAVVLTGNASGGKYYYYDPQKGTTGTIDQNDPRIRETYGYE